MPLGVDLNEQKQLELLSLFSSSFKKEYSSLPIRKPPRPKEYYVLNPYFRSFDAEVLYCMIRHFKPQRIIEIGSGYSTLLATQATRKNREEDGEYTCEITSVDPFPPHFLEHGFASLRLLATDVENVPLSEFEILKRNDILFVDSSHVVRTGGDVCCICLNVLPRLSDGVLVQIHDIFLPEEYPRYWVMKANRFWSEQYILQAFLAFNRTYEVLWASNYMRLRHHEKVVHSFPAYETCEKLSELQRYPCSFWIRRVISSRSSGFDVA
jgi:hypothetical protein